MAQFTTLNLEQSLARFLADAFLSRSYQVYWRDTKQTEGTGSPTVTILRDFPDTPAYLVHQSETQEDHLVKVPAFAIQCFVDPWTTAFERLGVGESAFTWRAEVRIDGFADSELQWYALQKMFQEVCNPDARITLRDYQADLTIATPPTAVDYVELDNISIRRLELGGPDQPSAARYYINVSATARYPE
jgi:hypothetical protein